MCRSLSIKISAVDSVKAAKIEKLIKKVQESVNPDLKTTAEIYVEMENIGLENILAYFSK